MMNIIITTTIYILLWYYHADVECSSSGYHIELINLVTEQEDFLKTDPHYEVIKETSKAVRTKVLTLIQVNEWMNE